ncbi:DUF6695 family protein [Croceiramulus getboli]|nr:hypothetical protein P8624_01355 [Flavobacteriaceae bacterium YJPT1-3]
MSDELLCKILPWVGLGTSTHIKAGHAALVLIHKVSGQAYYYDFGRYITPPGKGRVRSAHTDAELHIPIRAQFEQNELLNLHEFLSWLSRHPEKTHGDGRMIASLCDEVDFDRAQAYILGLQMRGSIPYKAFGNGSNCSRFVTETLLASTWDEKLRKGLNQHKKFTPSTVGNVEKSAGKTGIFEVIEGEVKPYRSSALQENLSNYFDKRVPVAKSDKLIHPIHPQAQFLSGTGSSAYFRLEEGHAGNYKIHRYTERGVLDFSGLFAVQGVFDIYTPYTFTYDSHCSHCRLVQNGKTFDFKLVERLELRPNSAQKAHSA